MKFCGILRSLLTVFIYASLPLIAFTGNLHREYPRLLVLTDIGGDPDDIQSLRRLLLYSNEFRIEGLIATASKGPKESRHADKYEIFDKLIYDAINDYASVRNNLLLHSKTYPSAEELLKLVKKGQADLDINCLSKIQPTPASRHIIEVVDAGNEPLCIVIWGGAHDLAQALLEVKTNRSPEELKTFITKIKIYAIADQHKIPGSQGAGEWIIQNFPDIWYVQSGISTVSGYSAAFRGMYQNDSDDGNRAVLQLVKPGLEKLNNQKWVESNVLTWGPLGAGYPPAVNQNVNTPRNTRGVKEGDTPSWFYFLPNGLNDATHPEWGGWGGRFENITSNQFTDTQDNHWSGQMNGSLRRKWTVARWREAYQNDFAARMQWCVLPFGEANHKPVAIIDGDSTLNILVRDIKRGKTMSVDARSSFDPDGNKLFYNWWIYHEPSSSTALLNKSNSNLIKIKIPLSAPQGDVHLILEVTDNGNPKLFTYRRVILKICPD